MLPSAERYLSILHQLPDLFLAASLSVSQTTLEDFQAIHLTHSFWDAPMMFHSHFLFPHVQLLADSIYSKYLCGCDRAGLTCGPLLCSIQTYLADIMNNHHIPE